MPQLTIQQAFDLAAQHHQAGRLHEAEQLYLEILRRRPEHPLTMHALGILAHQAGRNDIASEWLRRAIFIKRDFAEAHCNLGLVLTASGQTVEAVAACRKAVALNSNRAEFHYNLGNALGCNGQLDESIAAFRRAIALDPNLAQGHNNLGTALSAKGELDESVVSFRRAIGVNPSFAEAHNNLAMALKDKGQIDDAIAACRQAIALKPDFPEAHSNLIFSILLHPGFDAAAIAQEEGRWNRQYAEPLRKFIIPHPNDRNPDRPLRIGYVSPDFRDHVVGRCLLPLLCNHDRRQFTITCYAHVPRPDPITMAIAQNADGWRDIGGVSDEEVARQVREDQIDILVDLALHTARNRLLVFARKPAPVQVTYLGYCGSTGMTAMDYRLSDPYLDPFDSAQGRPADADLSCYSEKTTRLPRSYWCYQPAGAAPDPSSLPAHQNGFVTFGCLNNFAKVSSAALDLWLKILAAVPSARLILQAPVGDHRDHIAEQFIRNGMDVNRVRFEGLQPWAKYAETYSQIDIALDPFPYGGGITTCDALWMGVPVVSLSGRTAVGRGGRSILCNLGLPELVASTADQYVHIATDLARDPDRMKGLRQSMRQRMLASPLMDAAGFARDVEAAYRQMWRTWCGKN
jgi:predicted O-linked N-acetylglucosamine transferase (SPINDLY family)